VLFELLILGPAKVNPVLDGCYVLIVVAAIAASASSSKYIPVLLSDV
jgi:hypothetical protein